MKSPIVRWLIALNILVLCGVLLAFFGQWHRQQQARQAQRMLADKMVQRSLQNDDATPAERAQLKVINESVVEGRPLTDDQFSFLMTQASKQNSKGTATVSQMTAAAILEIMHHKLFGTGAYVKEQEISPANVVMLSDLTGGWHGHGDIDAYFYTSLFGDGHVKRLNNEQWADDFFVEIDP